MNKVEREALAKTKRKSDFIKAEQKRLEGLVRWEHVDLSVNTSGEVINCVHTAVGAGLDHWWKFIHWQVPVGMTAKLVFQTPVRFKQYATGGEEQARDTELMLGMQKVGKAMPVEITRLLYSTWYDLTWVEQLNAKVRESLIVGLGTCYEALFWEGEQIQLLVKNSSIAIPSTPHASTLIAYPCQVLTNADLARQLAEIKTAQRKARGIDVAD